MSEPTPSQPQHDTRHDASRAAPAPLWRRLLAAHVARVDRWHARAEQLGEIAVEGGAASLETGARLWRESLGASQALGRAWWDLGRKLVR